MHDYHANDGTAALIEPSDREVPTAALWAARALWVVGTAACLLASDLPIGIEPLRRIAHYGKLRAEVASLPVTGAFPRLQQLLTRLSLPPRAVWTAYYLGGAAINTGCLLWEVI